MGDEQSASTDPLARAAGDEGNSPWSLLWIAAVFAALSILVLVPPTWQNQIEGEHRSGRYRAARAALDAVGQIPTGAVFALVALACAIAAVRGFRPRT